MKKVVLSLLAFGLISAAAFAQDAPKVTIGEWGRQLFSFTGGKDTTDTAVTQSQLSASWGNNPRIVGLNIQADAGNAGFSITPSADNGDFGLTDQNKAWIKPMDGLTVESGLNLQTDTWRGIHDFGNWNWLRFSISHNDSVTFSRLGEGGSGFATDVNYNKDGIGAWVLVQTAKDGKDATASDTSGLGSHLQAGFAYTIKDIGQIKAQYLGANLARANLSSKGGNGDVFGVYEVAFNLSAVKGLYEEIGVTVPSSTKGAGYDFQIANQLGYAVSDKATANLQVLYASYNDAGVGEAGSGLAGALGLDYDLGDSVSVGGDVRYQNALANFAGTTSDFDAAYGVTIGVTKGFANGLIGIAFEYVTGASVNFDDPTDSHAFNAGKVTGLKAGDGSAQGAWAIPVRLEYWF